MVKIVGIVLSVVGICFMAADSGSSTDEDNSTKLNTGDGGGESMYNRMMGNMLTLVAATSYGLYEVLYERYAVGKEKNVFLANQITGTRSNTSFI
jgi:drug/metabolite transporter (DMT)-like permease